VLGSLNKNEGDKKKERGKLNKVKGERERRGRNLEGPPCKQKGGQAPERPITSPTT